MGEKAKSSKDAFGDRMKGYESLETDRRAMTGLPLVVRVDGRSFSKFTRGMARPYDTDMANLMVETAKYLVEETNAKVGYTQSDEITLILSPFDLLGSSQVRRTLRSVVHLVGSGSVTAAEAEATALLSRMDKDVLSAKRGTEAMFAGRYQKLVSIIASLATARFLKGALALWPERCARQLPLFDCRVFSVPSREEAVNVLLWREQDASRNAVSMAAQARFSHGQLQNKSTKVMREMLAVEAGGNFEDYPARFKRGVYVRREALVHNATPEEIALNPERASHGPVLRRKTVVLDLPPLGLIDNRVGVLLDGEAVSLKQE